MGELLQCLTDYAAGSFIWAKIVVELVEKFGPKAVDDLEGMLSGVERGSVELTDNLYARMLFDIFGQLATHERKASRSILAAIVLAKDSLWKSNIIELLSSKDSSADETRRSVENAVDQLSCIVSADDNQLLRIPHKSFSDFFLNRWPQLSRNEGVQCRWRGMRTFARISLTTRRTAQTSL